MNFENIKSSYVKQLASSAIYERGEKYYEDGKISNLDYDNEQNKIVATCRGSQRNLYSIKIRPELNILTMMVMKKAAMINF